MDTKKNLAIISLLITLALLCSSAYAQDAASDTDKWRFKVTPYIWMAGMEMDASTINGQSVAGELDFKDILDITDFAGTIHFEAWKGDWGFIFDGMYMDLGVDADTKILRTDINADVDVKSANLDFALSRRLYKRPLRANKEASSENNLPAIWFDLMGGFRYAYLKQQVDLKISSPIFGGIDKTLGGSEDWVEPLIGGRIGLACTEKITIAVKSDVGGFGIGSASDLTWNIYSALDYKFGKRTSFVIGYRIYDIDYSKGSGSNEFGLDAQTQGPVLGITYRF